MPNTANKALPYPVATDTPDVPRDIGALVAKLDALLAATEYTPITDLNALVIGGRYFVDSPTNGPAGVPGVYITVSRLSATYIRQDAAPAYVSSGARYSRVMLEGVWQAWRQETPAAQASGSVAVASPPAANAGTGVAITFPVGLFSAAPHVSVTPTSNGYPFGSASAVTTSGFTARIYNPTTTTLSGVGLEWIATLP